MRRDLEQPLRKELAKSTFVDVGGFHDKYFKDKGWCSKTSEIYHNLCEGNGGDPLKGFTGMHSEDKIWAWLDDFQNKCLTDSLGKYFRTTKKGQTTTEAERQLDLFIKPRDTPKKEKHDMRDVRVVGELTSSKKQSRWLPKYIQLAIYIRDVFADQPTRRFVGIASRVTLVFHSLVSKIGSFWWATRLFYLAKYPLLMTHHPMSHLG